MYQTQKGFSQILLVVIIAGVVILGGGATYFALVKRPTLQPVPTSPAESTRSAPPDLTPYARPAVPEDVTPKVAGTSSSCPRTAGASVVRGTLVRTVIDAGGGKSAVLKVTSMEESLTITEEVFKTLQPVKPDTVIVLVSYVKNPLSGANPPYSCAEVLK